MIDYETDLALLIKGIESVDPGKLEAKVTKVTIEVGPGPVSTGNNAKMGALLEAVLPNTQFELTRWDPCWPYTRITIERKEEPDA